MTLDQWTLHGVEFENCPCAWGCPCQFGAQPTYGRCQAVMGGHIEKGNFNDTNLDGPCEALAGLARHYRG